MALFNPPGRPEADPSDEFRLGGWVEPYADEAIAYAQGLGKPLDRLIITHAHPDHYNGAAPAGQCTSELATGYRRTAGDDHHGVGERNHSWIVDCFDAVPSQGDPGPLPWSIGFRPCLGAARLSCWAEPANAERLIGS